MCIRSKSTLSAITFSENGLTTTIKDIIYVKSSIISKTLIQIY